MYIRSIFSLLILISIILIFIGSVFLQIVLSKKKNKFLGLIFPLMTFLMATIIAFGMYSMVGVKGITNLSADGEVVSEVVKYYNVDSSVYFSIIAMYIFFNIPTFIYLGIYFSYSKFRKELTSTSQDELMKMNIQDLE